MGKEKTSSNTCDDTYYRFATVESSVVCSEFSMAGLISRWSSGYKNWHEVIISCQKSSDVRRSRIVLLEICMIWVSYNQFRCKSPLTNPIFERPRNGCNMTFLDRNPKPIKPKSSIAACAWASLARRS